MRAVDVHGLLVGDDLDPALDLRAVSTRFATQGSGAITSGMLAVLLGGEGDQEVVVWRVCATSGAL